MEMGSWRRVSVGSRKGGTRGGDVREGSGGSARTGRIYVLLDNAVARCKLDAFPTLHEGIGGVNALGIVDGDVFSGLGTASLCAICGWAV